MCCVFETQQELAAAGGGGGGKVWWGVTVETASCIGTGRSPLIKNARRPQTEHAPTKVPYVYVTRIRELAKQRERAEFGLLAHRATSWCQNQTEKPAGVKIHLLSVS